MDGAPGDGPLILILGDSFLAPLPGAVLVDTLFALLGPRGVVIRNAARPGTGPVEYLRSIRNEGARHRPDVVLLGYYTGNDLVNVGCGGNLDQRLAPQPPVPRWKRMYTIQYVRQRVQERFPGRVLFQSVVPDPFAALRVLLPGPAQQVDYDAMERAGVPQRYVDAARKGELNPWVVSLGSTYPDYYMDELLLSSDCARSAWEDTRRLLDMILEESERLGATVLPVIFPHSLQVSEAHCPLYAAWKIRVDTVMLRKFSLHDRLNEYFRSRGLEPLDLLGEFRRRDEMLYWEFDEHMNWTGQRLAAHLVAEAYLTRYPPGVAAGNNR
jgi:hypothetical protein